MLHVEGPRKAYGEVVALQGVDLDVAAGEIVSLLGPNGAGKTTLVSIVAGLRRSDGGTVEVDGLDPLKRGADVRRRIGLAPQDLGVYPVVSVRNNLVLFGRLAGLGARELRIRIDEVAEALAPVLPTYWAMKGFQSVILEEGGLPDIAGPVAVLVLFGLVFTVLAAAKFRLEDTKAYYG